MESLKHMVAGYVEGLEGQTIRGWVMSNEGTCRISVADAEGNPLATGMADRYGQSPDPPPYRYGFRFRISLPAASPSLRVFADGQELAGSPVALGPDLFDGQISMVDGKIVGWVQERTVDATPRPVDIHDQYGRPVARVIPLTDGQEGPFRFAADAPASLHGLSEIGLVAICNGVVFAKTTCCLPVKGYLEHVGSERVGGWALIPGLPNRKLRLQLCLDGEPVVEATCDMLRGDLEPVYPSADQNVLRCGFDVSLPPPPRGTAPILSVRLAESQVELFNGPRGIGDVPWVVHSLRKANQMLSDSANLTAAEQDFLRQAFAKLTAQTRTSNARTLSRHALSRGPNLAESPACLSLSRSIATFLLRESASKVS